MAENISLWPCEERSPYK